MKKLTQLQIFREMKDKLGINEALKKGLIPVIGLAGFGNTAMASKNTKGRKSSGLIKWCGLIKSWFPNVCWVKNLRSVV